MTTDARLAYIPTELKDWPQWVCWKREMRDGKPTKVPYVAAPGKKHASSTDPATWRPFEDACTHASRFDGIGFAFSADDPYCGVDLDGAIDPETGEARPAVREILRAFGSYTEASPSGTGLHILCRATLTGRGTRKPFRGIEVEMYDRGRYFTVTGRPWADSPGVVADCHEAAARLYAEIKGKNGKNSPAPAPEPPQPLNISDEELLAKARASANGQEFSALFDVGDTSAFSGDDSRADFALCSHLNFWAGNDPDRVDRLFRQSALMRDKWDRPDYSERTITNSHSDNPYTPGRNGKAAPKGEAGMEWSEAPDVVYGGPVDGIRLTDLGNARRLIKRHGRDLRYDHVRGCWFVWNGKRWERDQTAEVERRAKDTVAAMYAEASDLPEQDRQALDKHALRSEAKAAIANMIALAASEPGVSVLADEFDRNQWLLNCQNGTVDLRTGELRSPRREDLINKITAVDFDMKATHPVWDDLLKRVTGGNPDILAYLQTAAGYSLTGTAREDKAFALVSEGGGGKTSFLEPMVRTLGDYATVAEESTFLARHGGASGHSEDVAALAGARLLIATELGQGRLAEERFKRMTGGDTMRASRKHEQSFEFRPVFKLWLAANTAPKADDADTGVWRRLRYIPWTPVPESERDPKAKETLMDPAQAGAAILAWMVLGCLRYQRDGLGDPPAITSATEERRRENNPLAGFFADCCVFKADLWTTSAELRAAYEEWCRDNGCKLLTGGTQWGDRLREHGALSHRSGTRGRHWTGIGLLSGRQGESDAVTDGDAQIPYVRDS